MQLMLILGIVFAIVAVLFALQNNILVAVSFAFWQFEGSLALVLLLALGLGVLITCLISSPSVIRRQWANGRLRRQAADLERQVAEQAARIGELSAELGRRAGAAQTDAVPETKPYVGLRSLLAGDAEQTAKPGRDDPNL
jgi:lipopolysaccharide assembly protein A